MVWKPNVTVAAIIERNGRFLLVEEETPSGLRFNQPAGHLEEGEDLLSAAIREVREEAAWQFEPQSLVAVQLWRKNPQATTFLRVCLAGVCHSHDPGQPLDTGIVATHWLTRDEIAVQAQRLRSLLVLEGVERYLAGQRFPLDIVQSFLDVNHE